MPNLSATVDSWPLFTDQMDRASPYLWLMVALSAYGCAAQEGTPSSSGTGGSASGGAAVSNGGSTATSSGGGSATGGSVATTLTGGSLGTSGGATGGATGGVLSAGGGAPATPSGGAPANGGGGATSTASGGAGGTSTTGGTSATGGATAGGGSGAAGASGSGGAAVVDPGTDGDGNSSVGPTYTKSPDLTAKGATGKNFNFTMSSADSKIFTGLDTTLNTPQAFTRRIDVHVPAKYQDGTAAPFMVVQDGAGGLYNDIRIAVDNFSQATDPTRRLPAIIVIAVANGGGDSLGSQRGLEYDTMSDRYARLIDEEVLPAIVANAAIKAAFPKLKFTDDPEGRGSAGCSSGASAALIMGWFKPDRYRRIIGYSATLVAQQDTDAPERTLYPHGAWDFHSDASLIANTDVKPLRVFINANQNDNGAGTGAGNRHDWLLANQRTAAALKAKNYHYRYVEGQGAGHCDSKVQDATVPDTMLWLWRGYPTGP